MTTDANTAALNRHMDEMDESDQKRERITQEVWQDLASGYLHGDGLFDCAEDAVEIAIYECCKDNRPAYATWYEPRHAYRDFYADIEALVENEIELRMSR